MTYRGTMRNGVIVLEEGAAIAEGQEVVVLSKAEEAGPEPSRDAPPTPELSSLSKALLRHAGTVPGLPADFAKNHDHYLYGTPKRD